MAESGAVGRYLVCEPRGYGVHHILNPWMRWTETVDVATAIRQWTSLCSALERAGARLEFLPHTSRSGAMTFTRDTAVVVGDDEALILRNVGRRGDLEPDSVRTYLRTSGRRIEELADGDRIDGGNVVPVTDGWLIGMAPGAERGHAERTARTLRDRTGLPVHGIPLAPGRFGHLDTALADLAGRAWLAHTAAFAEPDLEAPSWERIIAGRPVISVDTAEAEGLGCNVVVVNDHVIGGLSERLCRDVERVGLEPVPLDLDEFRKAGGGAHCLTLELDPFHPKPAAADAASASPPRRAPCHAS